MNFHKLEEKENKNRREMKISEVVKFPTLEGKS
jgi:hypothetical protein